MRIPNCRRRDVAGQAKADLEVLAISGAPSRSFRSCVLCAPAMLPAAALRARPVHKHGQMMCGWVRSGGGGSDKPLHGSAVAHGCNGSAEALQRRSTRMRR